MADDSDRMRQIQHDQINRLRGQIALPDHRGRHAAACLAHLVKPGRSLLPQEALDALLGTLRDSESKVARQRAVRELAMLAENVNAVDLSDKIVPGLITMLNPPAGEKRDVLLARLVYLALRIIGTPDAFAALDAYHDHLIEAMQARRTTSQER